LWSLANIWYSEEKTTFWKLDLFSFIGKKMEKHLVRRLHLKNILFCLNFRSSRLIAELIFSVFLLLDVNKT
jgi:hypothetical protein